MLEMEIYFRTLHKFRSNILWLLANKYSVKELIAPISSNVDVSFHDRIRLGPNTIARFDAVILFWSLESMT